jgi:hypothetical protein
MSGGTTFAKEVLDHATFAAAAEACVYFDLHDLASLMRRIAVMDDEHETAMDDEYNDLVPRDQVLRNAFEQRYAAVPGDFERLESAPSTPPPYDGGANNREEQ